jgi:anaerobic ribonucleoside-triphosphate reductase activating protein
MLILHNPRGEIRPGNIRIHLKGTSITHHRNHISQYSGGKMMMHQTKDHGCRHKNSVNLAGFLDRSVVNGPGNRAVIWVQGCPIRCEGCFNPHFWSFSPENRVPVLQLAERITALKNIDGVTFSGGEPFCQAEALAALGERIQETGLTVVTFTGFSYDQILRKKRPSWQHLLSVTDLLIAGPYIPSLNCRKPLLGSSNQELIFLTGNNTCPAVHGEESAEDVEVTVSREGIITATGFPHYRFVRHLAFRCKGV